MTRVDSLREFGPRFNTPPAFVAAGLITNEELEQTLNEMQRLAADETVLALMPRVSQVWARKPAPRVSKAA